MRRKDATIALSGPRLTNRRMGASLPDGSRMPGALFSRFNVPQCRRQRNTAPSNSGHNLPWRRRRHQFRSRRNRQLGRSSSASSRPVTSFCDPFGNSGQDHAFRRSNCQPRTDYASQVAAGWPEVFADTRTGQRCLRLAVREVRVGHDHATTCRCVPMRESYGKAPGLPAGDIPAATHEMADGCPHPASSARLHATRALQPPDQPSAGRAEAVGGPPTDASSIADQ